MELVDSVIDDKQMGSDHCPVALKLRVNEVSGAVVEETKEESKEEEKKKEAKQESKKP